MANLFGSIPEPKPVMHEVIYQWMPLWSYHLDEIQDIKDACVRYDHNTFTMLEPAVVDSGLFDNLS